VKESSVFTLKPTHSRKTREQNVWMGMRNMFA